MIKEQEKASSPYQKEFVGTVVSDKMDKTITVLVDRVYRHPKFGKVIRANKKYKVHDEHGQAAEGDTVKIVEGRPRSKTKYMYLSEVVKKI